MEYQVIWFVLWGLLWAVYFMTDGFDLGVGILLPVLGGDDTDRGVMLHTIGPVWDGNEVWLVTAGGATFAAFPGVYALLFSTLYTPLLLVLFALIVRGAGIEFRGKGTTESWKRRWDTAVSISSTLIAFLFGITFGNLFFGLPINADGYQGGVAGLLNLYGILTGLLFLLLFSVHGALWLAWKTEGALAARAADFAGKAWAALAVFLSFFFSTPHQPPGSTAISPPSRSFSDSLWLRWRPWRAFASSWGEAASWGRFSPPAPPFS